MMNVRFIGLWSGLLACFFTLCYVVVQILQLQRVIPYPVDEALIYATSLSIVIPFLTQILALHYITAAKKRFWTHGAIIFTTMYAIFVMSNYVVQLATVLPMKLDGRAFEIKVLEQTPHSMFWNFDALGYILMGLAMLFAAPALGKSKIEKLARYTLLANALVTPLIAIVYFYPSYSETLLMLGYPWAVTAPLAMFSLAFVFRGNRNKAWTKIKEPLAYSEFI